MKSIHKHFTAYISAITLVSLACFGAPAGRLSAPPPEVAVTENGASLAWQGIRLLKNSGPAATRVVFQERTVNPENNYYDYSFEDAELDEATMQVDKQQRTVTRRYPWGTLAIQYKLEGSRLRMRLSAENRTERDIATFRFRLLTLPLTEVESMFRGDDLTGTTLDRPTAIKAQTAAGPVYASYESFAPPIRFGFAKLEKEKTEEELWQEMQGEAQEGAPEQYALIAGGGIKAFPRDGLMVPPKGLPHIPAGKTLTLEFAIRFAGKDEPRHVVLNDFYRDFQEFQNPMLEWPDHRPIAAGFLYNEIGTEPPKAGVHGTNPRRLFAFSLDTVDAFSPQGQNIIRRNMTAFAHSTVTRLQKMGAQGVMMWNMDTQHPYLGAPRMLSFTAPELEDAMDDYFRIVREAGFRTGVTIRHQQARWGGNRWSLGVGNANPSADPLLDGYHKLVPEHTPWWMVYPVADRLSKKIAYAKERWGCTIFYYDTSNIIKYYPTEDGQSRATDSPAAHIYRKIREDHPDVLIIPELMGRPYHIASLGHVAPYGQTGYGRVRPMMGPDYTRDLVPGYFGVHFIHDTGGDAWQFRHDRIHEICWGEILMTDLGWGPKQKAIAEFYRHGNAKLRRTLSLAHRFGVLEGQSTPTSLSNVMRETARIPASEIVADPPGSPQLRVHTVSSPDRKEAALFLAWYGWPLSPPAHLRADLPGVELEGQHRRVWDLETGNLLNRTDGVHVPEAPASAWRALLVRSTDEPPSPLPPGVAMRVSFDRGLAPDAGGGLLTEHGDAKLTDGATGRALAVGSGGEARYGAVPSWYSGTLEFKLKVAKAGEKPLPLVRFEHHMDASLTLVSRAGKPALRLQSSERNAIRGYQVSEGWSPAHGEEKGYGSGTPTHELREAVAPLPDNGDWHAVTLAWEAGQYNIFVNGEPAGTLSKLAMPRYRDGTILEPGLIFGGTQTAADGSAAIDDVTLYDWCLRKEDANGRTVAASDAPATRPEPMAPSVWLWGDTPDTAKAVTVNARRSINGRRTKNIRATLFEKKDGELRKLSSGGTQAYRGLAMIVLEYEPEAGMESDVDAALHADEAGDHALAAEGMTELVLANKEFVLKVVATAAGENPPEREITFEFGLDKKGFRQW